MQSHYYVYILTNRSYSTLYTGVTNNIEARILQHRERQTGSFSNRYNVNKLVFEETASITEAIALEKRIKGWTRAKKLALIESQNPGWHDLAHRWFAPPAPPDPSFLRMTSP